MPSPKPKAAPTIEPHRNPAEATISGVRSAETPKTVICETALSWRIPPSRPISTSRVTAAGGDRHPVVLEVGVRVGQDLHEVGALEVGGGLDVDPPVEVAVADVDALDDADRDRPRVARLEVGARGGRARGVDELALADAGVGVDRLEQQVAGGADRDLHAARLARRAGHAAGAELRVGDQRDHGVAARRLGDLADQPGAVDHGVAAVHAVVGALVDRQPLVPGACCERVMTRASTGPYLPIPPVVSSVLIPAFCSASLRRSW